MLTLSVADVFAFAGLMGGMIAGGVSALVWLLTRIGNLDKQFSTRLTRIETILELAFPEAKERAMILDSSRRVADQVYRQRAAAGRKEL